MEIGEHPTRRQAMAGLAATSATLLAAAGARAIDTAAALAIRGVVYDTGTDFGYEGYLSRMSWHEADVRREMAAISDELHCTSVQIVGTDVARLELAARIATELRLQVWLQPRLFEVNADRQLEHLLKGAGLAQRLRNDGADIVFSLGCETTLFQQGIVPGATFSERIQPLFSTLATDGQRITSVLNTYLARAASAVRERFEGPLTYSAGSWEFVDWTGFDYVGVNLYRDSSNRETYREGLREHMKHGRPLVITEFGCATFEGAADAGGGGFMIVDYSTVPPSIPDQFVRSEEEQAREIADLLALYGEEGVAGAFVYNFLAQFDAHSANPREDLDMASHAIVKTMPGAADAPLIWEPKLAFYEVARIYRDL